MKLKNKRRIFISILFMIIGMVSFVAYMKTYEKRFLITCFLSILCMVINMIQIYYGKDIVKEIEINNDERDIYITMKTSYILMKVMNNSLLFIEVILGCLYAFYQNHIFLVSIITIFIILVSMFIGTLCINVYLERKE